MTNFCLKVYKPPNWHSTRLMIINEHTARIRICEHFIHSTELCERIFLITFAVFYKMENVFFYHILNNIYIYTLGFILWVGDIVVCRSFYVLIDVLKKFFFFF